MTGPIGGPPRDDAPTSGSQLPPELDPRRGGRPGAPPPQPSRKGKTKKKRPLWFRITRWVAAGLVVIVLLGVLTGWALLERLAHEIGHGIAPPKGGAAGVTGDLNILLLGSDSRAGLTTQQEQQLHVGNDTGQRSDTMILLHIPRGGGKAVLVSLPRDSYVTIPKHKDATGQVVPASQNKLNTAYSFGGIPLTLRTIEMNTGIHIDHYVAINFLGFVNVVNALGGVDVCTPTPIHDPVKRLPTGGFGGSGLELPAGTSHLDGVRALEYVRAREFDPSADLGRIQRQQRFLASMVKKAKSAGILLNPVRLTHVVDAVAHSLTTDPNFGVTQIKDLAEAMRGVSANHIEMLTVPLKPGGEMTAAGSVVEWDPTLSKELFHDLIQDKPLSPAVLGKTAKVTIPPSSVSVQVLNSTKTNGFAAKAASDLTGDGFLISGTGNSPKGSDPSSTVIQYGPDRADSVKTVAAAIPSATTQEVSSLGSSIRVLLGSDYDGVVPVKVASTSGAYTEARKASQNICS